MANKLTLNRHQLRENEINRDLIDITTPTKSLILSVKSSSNGLLLEDTGADDGTGDVTINLNSNLEGLSQLSTNGILIKTGSESFVTRSIVSSNGLTITNSDGITNNIDVSLTPTGITAGAYKYVIVDEYGRVTEGSKQYEHFITNEILETTDDIHYTLEFTPVLGSEMIFVSGNRQVWGADRDYTINGRDITFTTPNLDIDVVVACYFHSTTTASYDIVNEKCTHVSDDTRYSLSSIPQEGTLMVFLNGQLQIPSEDEDYTWNGATDIVFTSPNGSTDIVSAYYFK
jgi:hypothetical protein